MLSQMKKSLYLDSNVFVDLHTLRSGVTKAERSQLLSAIRSGKVEVPLSVLNFEESMHTSCETFNPKSRFEFMLRMTNWNRIFGNHGDLIEEEVSAFCSTNSAATPFIRDDALKKRVIEGLQNPRNLLENDEFLKLMKEARTEKLDFMTHGKDIISNFKREKRRAVDSAENVERDFNYLYDHFVETNAAGIVEKYGMSDECQKSGGTQKLLEKSDRFRNVLGYAYSLIYAEMFENREPDLGDRIDIQHVIFASCTDYFVTHDRKFSQLLQRVPHLSLQHFGSLAEFLEVL